MASIPRRKSNESASGLSHGKASVVEKMTEEAIMRSFILDCMLRDY